jgi:hypothetical protein
MATEADQIRDTERARLRALVSGDVAAARPFHAPEFQLITPRGIPLSLEDYLGELAAGDIRYLIWEPGEIAVRLHGAFAIIRYRAELQVASGAHVLPKTDHWHTDSYEYRDGRWLVVWSQATAVR